VTKSDQSRDRAGDEMVRLTVAEAALKLGISEAGVRKRVQRNQIPHERDDDGSLRVWVSPGEARHAESRDAPEESRGAPSQPESRALISEMRGRIASLEHQLEQERQANSEHRRLLAAALERIPPQLEAPQESPEDAETVEEAPEEAGPPSAAEEARDELVAERARREVAESTMHEGMAEERRRREEAERERDGLRRELHALRGREEAHEAAEEQQGRGPQPQSAAGGHQEGSRRPWWRRMFRG
jgi:hypothetical protein